MSENSIERQFTAKALIGKDVYDNSGKKVGEVRDVVLDSSRAPQLATALSMRSGSRGSGSSSSSGAGVSASGATGANGHSSSTTTGDASASGATSGTGLASTGTTSGSGSLGATGSTSSTSGLGSTDLSSFGSGSEPAAIVSYGGFMGAGGTLFRVPLSQLRYDSSSDHIALNVSDNELSSLKNSDTSRGAAE